MPVPVPDRNPYWCPNCGKHHHHIKGRDRRGSRIYRCRACGNLWQHGRPYARDRESPQRPGNQFPDTGAAHHTPEKPWNEGEPYPGRRKLKKDVRRALNQDDIKKMNRAWSRAFHAMLAAAASKKAEE